MKTKELAATAFMAALTAVLAQVMIPLPFTPVPLSMCVFAVYMAGAVLEEKQAVYSQIIYILLGAAGLPVFGGMSGGAGVIAGPTGGYILTYPLMAFLVATTLRRFKRVTVVSLAAGMLLALAACYAGGSLWYCAVAKVTWAQSLVYTVLPFIPLDIAKIAVCAPLCRAVCTALAKAGIMQKQAG
jgi:biotin transport system substrate-specific component